LEISLFEPRIPQNTGSIARTCAAFDLTLNLIEPLGFKLEDKYLKRAGLDYWPLVKLKNCFYQLWNLAIPNLLFQITKHHLPEI